MDSYVPEFAEKGAWSIDCTDYCFISGSHKEEGEKTSYEVSALK